MSESTEAIIQQAISFVKADNRKAARKALSDVLKQEPNNARAWYLLSQVVEEPKKVIYCLERVIKIQPDYQPAIERLSKLNLSLGKTKELEQEGQKKLSQSEHDNQITQLDIDEMGGFQFEEFIGELLKRMGLVAQVTKKAGDGGIDIIAFSDSAITGGKFVIQCKRYSSNVGEPQIRDLYGVVHHENASKGILITNSEFTLQAQKFAEGKPLELVNGEKLRELIVEYGISDENVYHEKTKVLVLPKEQKELVLNILHLCEDIEIRLGEEDIILFQEKKVFLITSDYWNLIGKTSEDFSVLVQQFVNVFTDISSQPIESITTKYIKSRIDIIKQIIDTHFSLINSIRRTNIDLSDIPMSTQSYKEFMQLYWDYKKEMMFLHKNYLQQIIIFFKQFRELVELDGKRVDIDYTPGILNLTFSPHADWNKLLDISNQINQKYRNLNRKPREVTKKKRKKGLFGLF